MKCSAELFTYDTPTVFIVTSPFQLLCAIEARSELNVSLSKFVFALNYCEQTRNEQLFKMANKLRIEYDRYYIDDIDPQKIYTGKLGDYKRAFCGNYHSIGQLIIASWYLGNDSNILFMDDGTTTIQILKGTKYTEPLSIVSKLKEIKYNLRHKGITLRDSVIKQLSNYNITVADGFYTIFYDVKSSYFTIYPNHFKHLTADFIKEEGKHSIYVVGMVVSQWAQKHGMNIEELEGILWVKLAEIRKKYPLEKIYYIAHGRCDNVNIPIFCNALDIRFMRLSEAIEFYFIDHHISPIAIYGMYSTALITLKRMYEETSVINWFIDKHYNNPSQKAWKQITRYYQKNNIITEKIAYPQNHIILFIDIMNTFKYIYKKFLSKCTIK